MKGKKRRDRVRGEETSPNGFMRKNIPPPPTLLCTLGNTRTWHLFITKSVHIKVYSAWCAFFSLCLHVLSLRFPPAEWLEH